MIVTRNGDFFEEFAQTAVRRCSSIAVFLSLVSRAKRFSQAYSSRSVVRMKRDGEGSRSSFFTAEREEYFELPHLPIFSCGPTKAALAPRRLRFAISKKRCFSRVPRERCEDCTLRARSLRGGRSLRMLARLNIYPSVRSCQSRGRKKTCVEWHFTDRELRFPREICESRCH
jgi:hypothetical protein